MAMWPTKPEILISLELWQIGWQFKRQIWCFRPRSARRNWPRAIATTTDNRKWQYRRFAHQSCNFWQSVVVAIIWLIFRRARHHLKSRIWRWNFDAICQSSRDVTISGFGDHIDISGCRSLLYFTCRNYFPPIRGLISQICRWNFNCTFHNFRDINISGFGRHFRLSLIIGSPRYTSCLFAMVECLHRFAVGMLVVYYGWRTQIRSVDAGWMIFGGEWRLGLNVFCT